MNKENKELKGACQYFHNATNNWNCAQSLYKYYQPQLAISDEDIELKYRSKGGGRAEGGICGAYMLGWRLWHIRGLRRSRDFLTTSLLV